MDLPYSSAARYNWRVDNGVAERDGICKGGGQRSMEKAKGKGYGQNNCRS